MKKFLLSILVPMLVFLVFCGTDGLIAFWQGLFECFKVMFPLFFGIVKMELEDYLTSPYFITGVIMTIASAFGIWFGSKNGKILFLIVSIICEIAGAVSILMNVI